MVDAFRCANHAQFCADRELCPFMEFLDVPSLFFLLSYRRSAGIVQGSTVPVDQTWTSHFLTFRPALHGCLAAR